MVSGCLKNVCASIHTEPVHRLRICYLVHGIKCWLSIKTAEITLSFAHQKVPPASSCLCFQAHECSGFTHQWQRVCVCVPHHHLMGCHHTADLGAETLFLIARIFL